ncbi:glycosyl hydrolase 53 family protein [Georgenia satyanarayanai]|uniref:glycosyl hydrolase 53 family protein n=1 Tax=Georgenia satyanarayanai TaxID=860221 RepID=UPI00203D07A5|nr:glycosyl hydrolase 53 family protein [Georgenia satyanarayanai]MCM3659551.1 glycosyl hydrolase 53 family protein [Georgenia satyanarayanai]
MAGRTGRAAVVAAASAALVGGALVAPAGADDGPVDAGITVPRVEGMGEGWINGADFSSVLSLEESGVTFHDFAGNEADLFEVLADSGVNWARIRVWNEPYLEADPTKGYGAGNVDADRATEIGVRATEAGMRVLVNFHYSDFWAHPGQQYSPRAWRELSQEQRVEALYDYTTETLEQMEAAGVDVGMVQIGNETTNGEIAGTRGWDRTAELFDAGSRAVRDTLGDDVKVAVHFTNPERAGQYASVARELDERDVDYDVFLSSYYAFWHGTPENLTAVLDHVATTYDKEVAVAETSWTYTLEDGDGQPNSVRSVDGPYSASVQGQALAVRDVMQAVANVSDGRGIGTFYWEPAWIPVGPPEDVEENWELWQRDGSGWATTYSQEFYDPAGGWSEDLDPTDWADDFGGSGWDNQALFAHDGTPLESLRVYEYARTGSVAPRELDAVSSPQLSVLEGEPVLLPETVSVSYTDGTTEEQGVTWHDSTDWIFGTGTYTVRGTTEAGHAVTATVTVRSEDAEGVNLVVNPGFEDGVEPWTGSGTGYTISSTSDPHEGARSAHFYSATPYSFSIEQVLRDVPPGEYRLSAVAHGGGAGPGDTMSISAASGISTVSADFTIDGWQSWQRPQTEPVTVGADGVVTIRADLSLSGGAWGALDTFSLVAVSEDAAPADTTALVELVAAAEALDREAYTEESLAVLDAALARAGFVLDSPAPSQASVDAAVLELQAALDALAERPDPTDPPTDDPTDPPTDPTGPVAPPTEDADVEGPADRPGTGDGHGELPRTGVSVPLLTVALLLGLGATALVTRRRVGGQG